MHTPRFVAVIVLITLGCFATAHAAPTYSLQFESNSIAVAPNGSVDVNLYLVETLEIGDTSIFANDNGLQQALFDVSRVDGLAIITNAVADPAFDDDFSTDLSFDSVSAEGQLFAAGNGIQPDGLGRILLAMLSFAVGDVGSEPTTFSADDLGPGSFFTSDADEFGATGGTLELTILPEPASILLAGAGLLMLMRRRR